MSIYYKILIGIVVIFIGLQFFGIDKQNPTSDLSLDLITVTQPNEEVKQILKSACYDCHSNLTRYPWYTNITPLSWWIKDHIDEGRDELNFSEWDSYSDRRKDHKLDEVVELVEEGEMPLQSYTIAHSDARLTAEQKQMIIDYAKKVQQDIGYVPENKE
jgi:hypothetical protein